MADIPVSNTAVSDASHTVDLRQVRAQAEETAQLSVVWILLHAVTLQTRGYFKKILWLISCRL